MTKTNIFALLVVVVVSFFSWQVLLHPGFFTMHDDQQVARLFELDKSLSSGQFPVRWVMDLGFGYGYPLFNFYPPLTYYTGEVFHILLNTGFVDSTKIVWFLALFGSALTMYFLAREFFGEIGAVVSALFYLYVPYHAVDAYVRGALAELFSFVWLPLILLFSYKTYTTYKAHYAVMSGFFLALLMLTHNLIFLPFLGIYTLWSILIFLICSHKKDFSRFIFLFVSSTLICFGLTAFFWGPALFEKQYTLVDQLLIKSLASYKIHFVCLNQLWDSAWGYGGSVAGCIDGLSFKVGKPHVITSLLSLAVALYLWIKNNRKLSLVILVIAFLLLVSAFMTTDYSTFIWDRVPPLWYLQFPWRFLEFVAFFSSLLAGSVFLLIKRNFLKAVGALIFIITLIFFNAKYFTPQTFLPAATDSQLTSDQEVKWHVSSTSFEYLPKGVQTVVTNLGTIGINIDQSKIAETDYKVISGDLTISDLRIAPDKFSLRTGSSVPSALQMQITNFPGWKVWLDGESLSIYDQNPYKLITINIPPGNHTIAGRFTNTLIRSLGNSVSLVFLFGLTAYGLRNGIRRSS